MLLSRGEMERASRLYVVLRDSLDEGGNQAYEDQESVLQFQLAFCAFSQTQLETAHQELTRVSCRKTLPLVHADALGAQSMLRRTTTHSVRRKRMRHAEPCGGSAA
jgi:hypothetical protein